MNHDRREIDEAIEAGRRAIYALDRAESALSGARNFGIWDMLGGGFISGILKHSKIDEAQRELECVQRELDCFKKELEDIQINSLVNVRFDGVVKFIDLFCDNILVDVFVQSRIKDLQNDLKKVRQQVEDTINRLKYYRLGD